MTPKECADAIDRLIHEELLGHKLAYMWIGTIPPYSDSLDVAWQVVEWIQKQDVCCFNISNDVPAHAWRVIIKGDDYACKELVNIERQEPLAMVICKAALRLKKIPFEEPPRQVLSEDLQEDQ